MTTSLEHVNLTVGSIDETARFLTTAFPEFQIRGRGIFNGNPWAHVGTDETYIALNESPDARAEGGPLNHVGFVVDDAESLSERMRQAGFEEGMVVAPHPHRTRKYFLDGDGIEWEFVEYFSEDPAERNDYSA